VLKEGKKGKKKRKKRRELKKCNVSNCSHPMTPKLRLSFLFFIYGAFSVEIKMRNDDRRN